MALKDLVAPKAAFAEAAIEEIISDFIRYDPDAKEVHFTPAATRLASRAKVLVYLVALQGWRYVTTDADIPDAVKPADLERLVGIPGGTLRPLLKDLKDRHFIIVRDGAYSVHPASISNVKAEIAGRESGDTPARRVPPRRRPKALGDAPAANQEQAQGRQKKAGSSRKPGALATRFDAWIDNGFFDPAKTLAEVQKQFAKEGIIVPQSSIPSYLLRAVRAGRLTREEAEVNGKKIWVYQKA